MTLQRLEPCCKCPDHQRPYRNEDGWVLTGDPTVLDSLQAWLPEEWAEHCARRSPQKLARNAELARKRHHGKKRAA